jgi:SSS family solute:Na+ symporter
LPFIDRVGLVFLMCIGVGMVISMLQGDEEHPNAIAYRDVDTATTGGFNLAAVGVVLMLVALYATWW